MRARPRRVQSEPTALLALFARRNPRTEEPNTVVPRLLVPLSYKAKTTNAFCHRVNYRERRLRRCRCKTTNRVSRGGIRALRTQQKVDGPNCFYSGNAIEWPVSQRYSTTRLFQLKTPDGGDKCAGLPSEMRCRILRSGHKILNKGGQD